MLMCKKKTRQVFMTLVIFIIMLAVTININAQTINEQWSKQYSDSGEEQLYSIVQTNDGGYVAAGITAGLEGEYGYKGGWILKVDVNGNEQWSKKYGSESIDRFRSIQQTSDGGYIAVGNTYGSINGYTNLGYSDGWLIKVDIEGNEEWSHQYGGTGWDDFNSVVQTNDGGYIISGSTDGLTIDNVSLGRSDGWILKVDINGNEEWSHQYGTADTSDYLNEIVQTNDGKYMTSGSMINYNENSASGWILKINDDGNEIWSKQYGEGIDYLNSIDQTSDGNYIVAGDRKINVYSQEGDGWILKIDNSGNEIWSKHYGDSTMNTLNSIRKTDDGGYIVAGQMFDYNTYIGDGWVLKIDAVGNEEWSKEYGFGINDYGYDDPDTLYSIQQTKDGGYIAAGVNNVAPNDPSAGWIIKLGYIYELAFDANGGKGTMNTLDIAYNESIILPTNKFIKDGYIFKGWATSQENANQGTVTYQDEIKYQHLIHTNQVLYAVWVKDKVDVDDKDDKVDTNDQDDKNNKDNKQDKGNKKDLPKNGNVNGSIALLMLIGISALTMFKFTREI